jgi:hypothetical protein
VDEPPRRPDDDDWESRLPDDFAPIPDPRPKHLIRIVAVVVVAAMVATTAPVFFRLFFGRSSEPPPRDAGTIVGIVLSGPQCPVLVADSPCPDQPVATEITVTDLGSGTVMGVARSSDNGRFEILISPGEYSLLAGSRDKPYPRGVPTQVTVEAGRSSEVTLQVDTGIR